MNSPVVDSTLWNVLTGAGVAGVLCILLILGILVPKHVVDDLKEELREVKADRDAQRDRADTAVVAAEATRSLMTAIRYGSELAASQHDHGGSIPP